MAVYHTGCFRRRREACARRSQFDGAVYLFLFPPAWRRELRISPKAIYDIINRQRSTGSAAALRRPGPAHLLTDADAAALAELSEELDGEYTWEEITERFNEETGKNVSTPTGLDFVRVEDGVKAVLRSKTPMECSLACLPR